MAFQSRVLFITRSLITFLFVAAVFHLKSGNCYDTPRILQEPDDYYDIQDNFYGLEYHVDSRERLTYEWYHNGTLITDRYNPKFVVFRDRVLHVRPSHLDQRYQGTYQLFISFSLGKIFGRKIRVKFKVFGKFVSGMSKETRRVTIGRPYSLECPKHSYSTDCLYKWGYHSPAVGLRHVRESGNRIILENGTLFFSSIQEKDVRDFSTGGEGISCILECTWCKGSRMSHGIVIQATQQGNMKEFGPKLNTKLKDREILLGTSFVILRCAAEGNPVPVYQWVKTDDEKGEETINETPHVEFGPFNHSLILHNITRNHNGTYKCIVSSKDTQVNDTARIIVREKPEWPPNQMIPSQYLDVFTNLTWECMAKGDPPPTFTWYANATKLSTTDKRRYDVNGGKITFSRLLVEDAGMYECVAENGFGYIYQTAVLYVRAEKPQFDETNITRVLLAGAMKGILHCECSAIPAANYTWTKDGKMIEFLQTDKYRLHQGRILEIKQITHEDAGIYECIAMNAFGKDKQINNVTIGDISFVVAPMNMANIPESSMLSLYCKATSFFQVKYMWRFDKTELVYGDKYIWVESSNRLIIQNPEEADSGTYECVAYIDDPARVERSRKALVIVQGRPRQLQGFRLLANCTNSSALLAWDLLAIYNHTETYVIIEWRTTYDSPGRWHRGLNKTNAFLGETRVGNLTPWANVQFRGVSLNKFGFGEPSEKTQFKRCKTPPASPVKCPRNFHGIADGPNVLVIKWNKLKLVDFNGPGFNYTLKYRRSGDPTWQIVVLARTESQFTILNAGISQLWYFKIRASNNEGLGPSCLENSTYSGQSKPGAVLDLEANDIKDTSVTLTWSTDSQEDLEGNIDGFTLQYWHTPQGNITRSRREVYRNGCGEKDHPCTISIDGKSKEYTLSSLVPSSNHTVSLRAYNNAGYGPAKYLSFMTAPVTSAELSDSTHIYRRSWFITVISVSCFLIVVVLIIFLLRKRSERYPVRKREREKGGVKNYDDFNEPTEDIGINGFVNPLRYSEDRELDEDVNSVSFSDDKYDDDGSFIGEYGDDGHAPRNRNYEERFV